MAQTVTGEKTPQGAMDTLADEMDDVLGRATLNERRRLRAPFYPLKQRPGP